MAAAAYRHPYLPSARNAQRHSMLSGGSAKNTFSSLVTEVPKPVAWGSGLSCSILLAEPSLFLSGFDQEGQTRQESQGSTALLRGKLQLNITKNVKIKAVQLKLIGKARTEWPEGIPPLKAEQYEEETLRTQVLTFFNAVNDGWETDYGNQCSFQLKSGSPASGTATPTRASLSQTFMPYSANRSSATLASPNSMTTKELRRLSLQSVQSRSFGQGDSPSNNPAQGKGYRIFYPGVYSYSFELPIDNHLVETTKLQYGSVKWELQATVERAGAFKPNLHGLKEISVVRVPDQMSLETTEPISISRRWEDQLHYDIIISGKSFPIGSRIPIAFKLTPLAKVQIHKLKVYATEAIEYWTNDRRVTRKDTGRKILLLEKTAGKPLDPAWAQSGFTITSGGELSPQERREARQAATMRRSVEASRHNTTPQPLPEPSDNLLGDLDLGLESYWGSTEIEMDVQIPTCEMMAKNKDLRISPDCSWKNANVYHWIKVVMRLSRLDPNDQTGRRRHFEISIDSPFAVLDCRATQANTSLPEYCGYEALSAQSIHRSCGCPDARAVPGQPPTSPNSSTSTLPSLEAACSEVSLTPMPAAHLVSATAASSRRVPVQTPPIAGLGITQVRPIHLLRLPSYNPPAFDADEPPPPHESSLEEHFAPLESSLQLASSPAAEPRPETIMTPPPHYDAIIGTPSVDGLADYFSRLADYGYGGGEDSDSDEGPPRLMERGGRVNVANPRTPGGRRIASRSLEIPRPVVNLSVDGLGSGMGRRDGA